MPSFTRESGGAQHVAVMGVNRIGKEYTNEALENILPDTGPINFGIIFRPAPWIDIGYGFERGRRMLRFTLRSDFNTDGVTKFDPPPPRIGPRPDLAGLISDGAVATALNPGLSLPAPPPDSATILFAVLESAGLLVGNILVSADAFVIDVSSGAAGVEALDLERMAVRRWRRCRGHCHSIPGL